MQQAKSELMLVVRDRQGHVTMIVDKAGVNTCLYKTQIATTKDIEMAFTLTSIEEEHDNN